MNARAHTRSVAWVWPALALLFAAIWLWISWCRMPATSWNDVRLAPVFMAAMGEPVYTLPGGGVLTTWMYGPVPLWLWSPAVLARDALSAILTAGALNLALTLGALLVTCLLWPCVGARASDRWLAFTLSVALWPEAGFRFLQADNIVVASGLVANLLLVRAMGRASLLWPAALATALALGSKQTAVALLIAQSVWLFRVEGLAAAAAHAGRTLLLGGALALAAAAQFGARELWFGVVTVPAQLPWADAPLSRLIEHGTVLAGQWVAPLVAILLWGRRSLAVSPGLALAFAAWAFTLPFGAAGLLSTGGSTNNLHGYQLLLPAFTLALLTRVSIPPRWRAIGASTAVVLVVLARLLHVDHTPLRPAGDRIASARQIQLALPGAVWLPWSPLVTYFNEGRFDHAEDGIYVRFITGHPVSLAHARAHVPPHFRAMALPPRADWGVAIKLAGPASTEREIGGWRVVRWSPPASPQ